MVFSYYPGCTLSTQAKEMDVHARKCAEVLGFTLEEIDDWQCCGAVYPMGSDEVASKLSAIRALHQAKEKGQDLVTLCAACYHVLKRINEDMKNKEMQKTVHTYDNSLDYHGETKVIHFMEVLQKHVGFDKLKEKTVNPLKGRKIGAYYGCMLLRPSSILAFDDPENPQIFETFLKALGAEAVEFPRRNECCGGYISLKQKEKSREMANEIVENAVRNGAETLITACPLCLYNVAKAEGSSIYYFTKLLAEALGVKE
ncbi:MAG: CoB--CoM heterodisulfide reductase iron-sulfur subunit B family protein [Defluviitaleaceae bacterium]|nr:CoB--CoM heterodisulfide reductase iron-sulfur subunit B family protein [Defluviitaleaceae bacterium]